MRLLHSHISAITLIFILFAGFIVCPELAYSDVLYDNGPLVNSPGGGAGGADASILQTNLGMSVYGFAHQYSTGYRIADDFSVTDPLGWQIDQIKFFAYQTGSTTTSTITGVYLQIWDGSPDNPSSNIVFGDTTTNRLANTGWSNIYRVLDTSPDNTQRPIMTDTVTVGISLGLGTFWLDWMTDGSGPWSGPWAPPITITGQTTTGNALQYNTTAWAGALDSGTRLLSRDFPLLLKDHQDQSLQSPNRPPCSF